MFTNLLSLQILTFGDRTLQSRSTTLWVSCKSKRCFDVIASTMSLCLSAPVLLLTMAALKLLTGRCLKRTELTGRGCRAFSQFNLDIDGLDERHLHLKLFLMRWGITELPQLFNVFRGEMSMVGPEAVPCNEGERYRYEIPHYGARNFARPGMTGAAQQAGWGGKRNIRKRTAADMRYVKTSGLKDDLRLIKATLLPKRGR